MVYFQEEMIKDKRSALFILIVHFSDKSLSKGFNTDFSLQLSIFISYVFAMFLFTAGK